MLEAYGVYSGSCRVRSGMRREPRLVQSLAPGRGWPCLPLLRLHRAHGTTPGQRGEHDPGHGRDERVPEGHASGRLHLSGVASRAVQARRARLESPLTPAAMSGDRLGPAGRWPCPYLVGLAVLERREPHAGTRRLRPRAPGSGDKEGDAARSAADHCMPARFGLRDSGIARGRQSGWLIPPATGRHCASAGCGQRLGRGCHGCRPHKAVPAGPARPSPVENWPCNRPLLITHVLPIRSSAEPLYLLAAADR